MRPGDSFLLSVAAIRSARALRPLITSLARLCGIACESASLFLSASRVRDIPIFAGIYRSRTGFTTSFALHFGQFKRSPFAAM